MIYLDPRPSTRKLDTRIRKTTILALNSLLMLGGCASVQVHMEMKVYLAKIPVKSTRSGPVGSTRDRAWAEVSAGGDGCGGE